MEPGTYLKDPVLPPFAHQREAYSRSISKRRFALFMDQGTGKSKLTIDCLAAWWEAKAITGAFILAPNDVHVQWAEEQIPEHMPKRIPVYISTWDRSSKKYLRELEDSIKAKRPGRLFILCMNHEAMATRTGYLLAKKFLQSFECAWILDESHGFKTAKAQRTRAVERLSDYAVIRRILTGTPGEPFDYYTQFRFLDWRILGFDSKLAFQHRFGIFTREFVKRKDGKLIPYESLQEYQRLEELSAKIASFCYIVKKEDCLDIPPKMYATRFTHLSKEQQRLYAGLKEEGLALLEGGHDGTARFMDQALLTSVELLDRIQQKGDKMSFIIKLTLSLRLQQIVGGFVTDDAGTVRPIDKECPRLVSLLELIQGVKGAVVIWAQYKAELLAITQMMAKAYGPDQVARAYGGISSGERTEELAAFKAGQRRILVAHRRSAGTGQNLQIAHTAVYYSNSYSYIQRTQSEDRIHRIGQKNQVMIYDLVAKGCPLDENLIETLKIKKDFADKVLKSAQFASLI